MAMVRTGSALLLLALLALTDALVMIKKENKVKTSGPLNDLYEDKVLKMQNFTSKAKETDLKVAHSNPEDPDFVRDMEQFSAMNETEQRGICTKPGMPCGLGPDWKNYPKYKKCCYLCKGSLPMCKKSKPKYRLQNVASNRWLYADEGVDADWAGKVTGMGGIPDELEDEVGGADLREWRFHRVKKADGSKVPNDVYRIQATQSNRWLSAEKGKNWREGIGAFTDQEKAPEGSLDFEILKQEEGEGFEDDHGNVLKGPSFYLKNVARGRCMYLQVPKTAGQGDEWTTKSDFKAGCGCGDCKYDDNRWYIRKGSKYMDEVKDD